MKQIVYCYDRMEFKVNSNITSVKFVYEDGIVETSYSFDNQPISVKYDWEGIEHIEKNGEVQKCVRYTPIKPGKLEVQMHDGERIVDSLIIDVFPSENHGYIKVSENDKRYFEYSDGSSFVPIGINMVYPTTYMVSDGSEFGQTTKISYIGLNQYRSWFKKASENGVNVARVWLGHEYFSPDTENAYEYDLIQFSKIDRIVELAKEYNIYLKLTFDNFRQFNYNNGPEGGGYGAFIFKLFNKRLYLNNERCENMEDWLTYEKYADIWLSKINELAKRYSGDVCIYTVEIWNEMNTVSAPFEKILKWNKTYLPKVKALFPHNMLTNSLGSLATEWEKKHYIDFCWDMTDFEQMHRYLDQGASFEVCGENPIEFISDGLSMLKDGKQPIIVSETGAVDMNHSGPFKYYSADDDGLIFADCVYTPFFCESAGCGQIWHWDSRYVEAKSLYKMFKPFKTLTEDIDVVSENFVAKDLSNDKAYILLLESDNNVLGYIRNKTSDWSKLLRDIKEVEDISELSIAIEGLKELKLIKIWDDNAEAEHNEDNIVLKNIHHGVMFKVKKR